MKARRGFTLVELMIALVIGSVVVLLAYSTLRAGMDVEARVTAARGADETTAALRAMLSDAIRHAVSGDARESTGLRTETDGSGRTTRLTFVSRGISSPLGGSGAWQIGLSADSSGVILDATPFDSTRASLRLTARGPRSFTLRFLAIDDERWRTGWNDPSRLPEAVEVRFLDAQGRETMAALVSRTAPVSGL